MAPTRTRQTRKSAASDVQIDTFNRTIPVTNDTIAIAHIQSRTPSTRSPIKKINSKITTAQKQALIDNLQLELTERARKLRAQYAMQAQGLRSRIELRVNRIPTAMRKKTIGELLQKYMESTNKTQIAPVLTSRTVVKNSPAKNLMQVNQSHDRPISPSPIRKRKSDEMQDHENTNISNPKKRVLMDNDAKEQPPTRNFSDKILSPRSANSRTLVRSPTKPSPIKSFLTRPISPVKPTAPGLTGGATAMLHNMVEKAKTSRAAAAASKKASATVKAAASTATTRARNAGPTPTARTRGTKDRTSTSSLGSDASSGTVVTAPVKKVVLKKSVMGSIKGGIAGVKKAANAHKNAAPTPAPLASGRTLRKRT